MRKSLVKRHSRRIQIRHQNLNRLLVYTGTLVCKDDLIKYSFFQYPYKTIGVPVLVRRFGLSPSLSLSLSPNLCDFIRLRYNDSLPPPHHPRSSLRTTRRRSEKFSPVRRESKNNLRLTRRVEKTTPTAAELFKNIRPQPIRADPII